MSDNFIQENSDIITLRAMANVFMPEALDPVGQEDDDVDNDGDSDKSDEYLKKRRKAVGSAIDKRKKKLKEAAAAHTSDDDKEITEKKVKNKVVINPEMKESKDYDPMEDDEFDHDEAEENRGVSGKNNPKGGKRLYKKREVKKEEVEQIDEMPYQVMGSPDGKKEKKIGKPVKSRKYADARAAELADTHKKTGGKYRSQYVEAAEDRAKDEHLMRGGMAARKDYDRPPAKKLSNKELGIKPGKTWVQKQMEKRKQNKMTEARNPEVEAQGKKIAGYEREGRAAALVSKFRKENPGSRQAKKVPGAKETEGDAANRRRIAQARRAAKQGLTSRERRESQARAKYDSPRD